MKSSNESLLKIAEKLLSFGKSKGASQMQISIGKSQNFSVEIRNGEIERLQEAVSTGLALKVIVDKKVASASSSDLSVDTLEKLVDNAVARARYSSVDEFAELPELENINVNVDSLELFDPEVETITPDKKIEIALSLEKLGKADPRIQQSLGSYFGNSTGESFLVNSNGFSGSYRTSRCSSGVELQVGEGDNMYEDGWSDSSISYKGLMDNDEIAKKAIHRATRLIGAKKIGTQNVPVIFDQQMSASLLGFLASCLYGSSIYMNRSFLAGKLDTKIAGDNINIIDDGLMKAGFGTRPFDGEGVPTRIKAMIENGVLKNYLLDTYSSKKLKLKSTGNAGGTTNFYMKPGTKTPEEIIKSVDKGLYLVKTIGQGTVPTSGDYSKGAYGIWIEKGELTYPVAEITISGNLGKMLSNIEMIGNDLEFRRSIAAPTFKISEITISGK
ncbi:MAG: TldD/PmbA family protein [Ignavibacteria bacterium]|nr:TldD/PmbA family protein [Ignavibacteria bacterium]